MQVEVSKYTDGLVDKTVSPNGLPQSLIRYDARQKEKALCSINDVVQTVKNPRASVPHTLPVQSTPGTPMAHEKFSLDYSLTRSAGYGNLTTAGGGSPKATSKLSFTAEGLKKPRKSGRISLMGFKGRSSSSADRIDQKEIVEPDQGRQVGLV